MRELTGRRTARRCQNGLGISIDKNDFVPDIVQRHAATTMPSPGCKRLVPKEDAARVHARSEGALMLTDSTSTQPTAEVLWRFGSFVLWEHQRRLERDGEAVRIGMRSFDLLLQLLKRAGEVISNEEFLASVWSGVVVEEASVRVHMSNLRKALGVPGPADDCREWIANVPLRGYRFVGRVESDAIATCTLAPAATDLSSPAADFAKVPVRLSTLLGRDAEIERLSLALASSRLVTVIGPGGIGKTSVAVEAAEKLRAQGLACVGFVNLASLHSCDAVLPALAAALGVPAGVPDLLQSIVKRLAGCEMLLLVDNCEHVIEPLSSLVIQLLAASPCLRILATSREALRIEGEQVLRVPPLALPDADPTSLEDAMRWPSIRMLVERACAAGAAAFEDVHAGMLARICRQMDGIPLAIELVAARLGVQAIGDLVRLMDDPMQVRWSGSRTGIARHRSLAAALDWSIALLDDEEFMLFKQLSACTDRFDVEAVLALTAKDMDPHPTMDALISLASKSLVVFDPERANKPYRMFHTTRSYAQWLQARASKRPGSASHPALPTLRFPVVAAMPLLPATPKGNKPSFWPQWNWIHLGAQSLVLAL